MKIILSTCYSYVSNFFSILLKCSIFFLHKLDNNSKIKTNLLELCLLFKKKILLLINLNAF